MNTPELEKQARTEAIASLRRYFEANMPEPIGELAAGLLLDFFVEEIGPVLHNAAVRAAQERIQLQVADLEGELYADPFQYWVRAAARKKGKRPS
ncbi:MAG TPA: DUF2164 domain-containing protein [Acidobacteriaceae bacterium]|jgi:uncharacterized protein (DUF2164 family)|nr:DUF2164 domain-containing protein [Acidobacteriaceae bacterium]